MRLSTLLIVLSTLAATAIASPLAKRAGPRGVDVFRYQGRIDWNTMAVIGVSFAYIEATEGTTPINPTFAFNYFGASNASIIRGGYHIARPDRSSGATQANFFLSYSGGWSRDGITLPGAVFLEDGCYGLKASDMVSWIKAFSNTYSSATGSSVIYTTTAWWNDCTGGSTDFGLNPLWLVDYSSTMGPLPAGWGSATFWQYSDFGLNPGNQDLFIGDRSGLKAFALGK